MSWMHKPNCLDDSGQLKQQYLKHTDIRRWATSMAGSKQQFRKSRHKNGAASLQNMAWRMVMMHTELLEPQSFKNVPWHVADKLWRRLVKHDLISVSLWQTFQLSYGAVICEKQPKSLMCYKNAPRLMAYDGQGRGTETYFASLLDQLNAPSFAWLTTMSVCDVNLPQTDWVSLRTLPNIGSLDISWNNSKNSSLNATVLRAWARAAEESNAFARLKTMGFRYLGDSTDQLLWSMQRLPALRILSVLDQSAFVDIIRRTLRLDIEWTITSDLLSSLRNHDYTSPESLGRDLSKVYDCVMLHEARTEGSNASPVLKTKIGPCFIGRRHQGDLQLWLERIQLVAEDHTAQQRARPAEAGSRQANVASKRPRLKDGTTQSMSDMLKSME